MLVNRNRIFYRLLLFSRIWKNEWPFTRKTSTSFWRKHLTCLQISLYHPSKRDSLTLKSKWRNGTNIITVCWLFSMSLLSSMESLGTFFPWILFLSFKTVLHTSIFVGRKESVKISSKIQAEIGPKSVNSRYSWYIMNFTSSTFAPS